MIHADCWQKGVAPQATALIAGLQAEVVCGLTARDSDAQRKAVTREGTPVIAVSRSTPYIRHNSFMPLGGEAA